MSKIRAISLLAIFLLGLGLRLVPLRRESLQYDAIVSQLAARKGIAANAWDDPETYWLRRHHPPLLSYVILLNNHLLGNDEHRVTIFSALAGAMTCALVGFVGSSDPTSVGLFLGICSGLLLCFLSPHLSVSRSPNWESLYTLFATAALAFLARGVFGRRRRALLAGTLSATLAFLTCELGIALAPVVLACLFVAWRMNGRIIAWREWLLIGGLALGVVLFLWPAGVLRLDLVKTLLFRFRDSATSTRNAPWYMFYAQLAEQAPGYLLFTLAGVGLLLASCLRMRRAPRSDPKATALLARTAPYLGYAAIGILLSTKQRLVYLHHIVDFLPCLLIAATAGMRDGWSNAGRTGRLVIAAACVMALGLSAMSATSRDVRVVGPEEHPGLLGIRDVLRDDPGATAYYYFEWIMRNYYGYPSMRMIQAEEKDWTESHIRRVKKAEYDYVVADWSMFDGARYSQCPTDWARYPDAARDADALVGRLAPEYRLHTVVEHRRTREPVAWIFRKESG